MKFYWLDFMKEISLTIGGLSFKARLLEVEAQKTCGAFLSRMPIDGKVIHAAWSGESVWFPMDSIGINVSPENQTSHPSRGDLLYYSGGISGKELLITYGSAFFSSKVGQLQGNHFASIETELDKLKEMGKKTLWEGAQPIRIENI
jgi:hypothetical protein